MMFKKMEKHSAEWIPLLIGILLFVTVLQVAKAGGRVTEPSEERLSKEQQATEAEEVIIGVLLPMSGTQAKAGAEVLAAVEMFVDIINEESKIGIPLAEGRGLPNLNGKKIKIVYGDLKSADTALSEAERLITSEAAIGICGMFSSATTKTAAVSTEKYKAILISEGTSPSLTAKGYEYFFRIFPDDTMYVRDTYQFLENLNEMEDAGIRTVAFVSEDTEFGKNIEVIEREYAEEFGFDVVENITYSSNATNLISECLKIKKADPDVLMMSSYISDVILYMNTFKQIDYMPGMIIGQRGGFMASELFTALGADAEGLYSTSAWALDLNLPLVQELNELYKAEYSGGVDLIADVLKCAADVYVLSLAVNQAGSTDVDAIKSAMHNLKYPSDQLFISGNGFTFDEAGQNNEGVSLISQIQDGKYQTVYPKELKNIDAIYPVPGWE